MKGGPYRNRISAGRLRVAEKEGNQSPRDGLLSILKIRGNMNVLIWVFIIFVVVAFFALASNKD